jgi:hypothetical protein
VSKGKYFIVCKNCGKRIDLGYDNPVKSYSSIVNGKPVLKIPCSICKKDVYYDFKELKI